MSQGTLYTNDFARGFLAEGLIKFLNLDINVVKGKTAEFEKAFPLGKIPAFVGPKGYKLTESVAIYTYSKF